MDMGKAQRETTTNPNQATDTNSLRITMAELSFNPKWNYQEDKEDVYNIMYSGRE